MLKLKCSAGLFRKLKQVEKLRSPHPGRFFICFKFIFIFLFFIFKKKILFIFFFLGSVQPVGNVD